MLLLQIVLEAPTNLTKSPDWLLKGCTEGQDVEVGNFLQASIFKKPAWEAILSDDNLSTHCSLVTRTPYVTVEV